MIVYKITNKLNNKIYIGQTINPIEQRWREHKNDKKGFCRYLFNAFNQYGRDNFEIKILSKCNSMDEMNHRETYYIRLFNTLAPNGYNILPGGGNRIVGEETRKRQSSSLKGKLVGKKNGMFGKGKMAGDKNPMFGKKRTEEARKKISQKLKGRTFSDSHKENISEANRGKKKSKVHRDMLSEGNNWRKVPIFCPTNGKTYQSIMSAARDLNLPSGNISRVINGKCRSIKGFTFSKIGNE